MFIWGGLIWKRRNHLRQKCMKQKLFKIVDLLTKYCLVNNLWELEIDFLNKIPTRFFFFIIFCYGFTSTQQPYQPNIPNTVSCQISWICSSTLCRKYPFIFLKTYFKSLKNEIKIIFKIIVTFMYEYVKKMRIY